MYVIDISGVATRLLNYDTVVYIYVYVCTLTHIAIFITILQHYKHKFHYNSLHIS